MIRDTTYVKYNFSLRGRWHILRTEGEKCCLMRCGRQVDEVVDRIVFDYKYTENGVCKDCLRSL